MKGGRRNQHWETNERLWRETRRQPHPTAGQNGDHAGRQMKGDKAAGAAKSRPESRSCRETNEGRKMKAGAAKSRPESRSCRETNEGRKMKAGAAKSRPEWRSRRETNEGRQGGRSSQEQARIEIMQGDKWREKNEGRGSQEQARMEITQGDKWRETNEGRSSQEQARMEITKGDRWRETRWQRQGFWGSATQSLRSKNPYSFQLSGEKNNEVFFPKNNQHFIDGFLKSSGTRGACLFVANLDFRQAQLEFLRNSKLICSNRLLGCSLFLVCSLQNVFGFVQ